MLQQFLLGQNLHFISLSHLINQINLLNHKYIPLFTFSSSLSWFISFQSEYFWVKHAYSVQRIQILLQILKICQCNFYKKEYWIQISHFRYYCGGAVGWGTALQVGRSRVLFPMVSLEFFIDIILLAALWPWVDSTSNRNEYQEYFLGVKATSA